MDAIGIRIFECLIGKDHADILRRRNNIELTTEHLEKHDGFNFIDVVEKTCDVDGKFFMDVFQSKSKKYINPCNLRDTDVDILDDGTISLRHDLPPERVMQLFWLQAIQDYKLECRCEICLLVAAKNAGV